VPARARCRSSRDDPRRRGRHNRFEYLDERKSALEAWGRLVESLVRPGPSNVVPLAKVR
jgi:hypothetical protein